MVRDEKTDNDSFSVLGKRSLDACAGILYIQS